VILAVELGDAGGGGGIVDTELFFTLAFFITAFEEVVPLIEIV
jgi:hypothetical protein